MNGTMPGRVRLAALVVVALAVGWVAMHAMHVGMSGVDETRMSMVASAQGEPWAAADSGEPGVLALRSTDSAYVIPASVHAPERRCQSLDPSGVVPRSGVGLFAGQALIV